MLLWEKYKQTPTDNSNASLPGKAKDNYLERGGLFVLVSFGVLFVCFYSVNNLGEGGERWDEEQKSKEEKALLNNLTAKTLFLTQMPSCFLAEQEEGVSSECLTSIKEETFSEAGTVHHQSILSCEL